MKRSYLLAILILLCGCSNTRFDFQKSEDYKYIQENINNIDKFIVETDTLLGKHCYIVGQDEGINALNQIFIKRQTNGTTTDSDKYYLVYFNDATIKRIKFEGKNLVYNDKKYTLKKTQFFFLSEDEIPSEIDSNDNIVLIAKSEAECN